LVLGIIKSYRGQFAQGYEFSASAGTPWIYISIPKSKVRAGTQMDQRKMKQPFH
jgi:hypothetical protein